jgi:voltage-gated potassium channel
MSPPERRRAVARALVATLATLAATIAVYYLLPLTTRQLGVGLLLRFVLAGVVFVAVLAWQVRQIVRSRLPALRAAQAVVVAVPLFLTGYALLYLLLARAGFGFSEELTRTSALYFTVVVFGSVGFGDITPTTDVSRIVVMSQIMGGVAFLAVAVRLFLAASLRGLESTVSPPEGEVTEREED